MNTSNVRTLVVVFALFICTSLVTAGCGSKAKDGWVNTSSMPGQTFAKHDQNNARTSNPAIVYLGSDSRRNPNFGPSFQFENLK